jgi:hypothetical protein
MGFAGLLIGVLHLAENLRLAEHHRIQARGDPEHMPHGCIVIMPIKELVKLARSQTMVAIQPFLRHVLGACRYADVKLGAIAGGKDHRFIDAGLECQFSQCGVGGIFVKRHLFAQANRRGEMVEPEGDELHDVMRFEAVGVGRRRLGMAGMTGTDR